MVDFITQGVDDGNVGEIVDRHPLKAAYEDSRLQDLHWDKNFLPDL